MALPMRLAAPVTSALFPSSLLAATFMPQRSEQTVYGLRKFEIVLRQSPDLVRGENEGHMVEGNVDIGMVFLLLREIHDALRKGHRLADVLELELARDEVVVERPARNRSHQLRRLFIRKLLSVLRHFSLRISDLSVDCTMQITLAH